MAEVACHREKISDFRGDPGKRILNKKAGLPRFARNDSVTVAFGVCHREEYANGIRRGDPEERFSLKAAYTLAEVTRTKVGWAYLRNSVRVELRRKPNEPGKRHSEGAKPVRLYPEPMEREGITRQPNKKCLAFCVKVVG